jgi:hypothetical protein
MRRTTVLAALSLIGVSLAPLAPASATHGGDTRVSAGSPPSPFSQNKQNEPAIAVDAAHPSVLAAGSNDNIDLEACDAGDPTTCPFTPGVGVSGIYFSFDSGDSWTQPTYSGLTARDCLGPSECTPHAGPIGTLPNYFENGVASNGDPALAFGPRPDGSGTFSWDNGSRLYYANITFNLGAKRDEAFRGPAAIAVSRIDGDPALTPASVADQSNWAAPVVVSRQSSATFGDKEQIWADNAASSPFFGRAYVCYADFRSNSQGRALPAPLMVATSTDGGDTWRARQVTPAVNNEQHFGQTGCTIRTDSHGVVYVFAMKFALGIPGTGSHILVQSFDGGSSWTRPRELFPVVDTCNNFDPVINRCVEDGIAGARDDLGPAPGVDIANGAPTGADATDQIVDTWVDGRDGTNNEHVFFRTSTDGGATWSNLRAVEQPGDRGFYSAPALSPNGTDVYLVYNAFTTPYRENTSDPRSLVGVVLHADVAPDGTVGSFAEIHRGVPGDPRGSSQNNLQAEFLGDYVYAAATRDYGAAVWNDARDAADCPAMDAWRMSLRTDPGSVPRPAPSADCPPTFGNSDIFGGSYADPTP